VEKENFLVFAENVSKKKFFLAGWLLQIGTPAVFPFLTFTSCLWLVQKLEQGRTMVKE